MTASNPTDIDEKNQESLGSLFRKTRISLHHSIETASESTRIHSRILLDLENDNYKKMPAEVFVRGFVKLYAEFLGLDPEQAMALYVHQEKVHPEKPAAMPYRQNILTGEKYVNPPLYQKSKRKISLISTGLLLLVLAIIIVSLLPENIDKPATDQTTVSQILTPDTSAERNAEQKSLIPTEPEVVVDRPPAITIEEETVSEPAADTGSSEPVERSPVLDSKPYKISRKSISASTSATAPVPADEALAPVAPEEAALSLESREEKLSPREQTAPGGIVDTTKTEPLTESESDKFVRSSVVEVTPEFMQPEESSLKLMNEEEIREISNSEAGTPTAESGTDAAIAAAPTKESQDLPPGKEVSDEHNSDEELRSKAADDESGVKPEIMRQRETEMIPLRDKEHPAPVVKSVAVNDSRQPETPDAKEAPQKTSQTVPEIAKPDITAQIQISPEPVAVKVVIVKPAAESEKESVPPEIVPDDPPVKYELKATFLESTWMRIQVDNKKPRQYTYTPGMVRTWKANRSIYLHLGNGGGVILTLNGKPLTTGLASGKVAKINIPDDIQ